MNQFEAVKAAVTPRMAAARYGLPIQQGSMVCCPFHADRTPSMKLNEDYFYCFGCGASGDVIDLAARLFSLSGYDAAKKLAADFSITGQKPSILARLQRGAPQAEAERRCFRVLGDYLRILQDWKPQERGEVVTDLQKDEQLMRMEARNRQIREEAHGTK